MSSAIYTKVSEFYLCPLKELKPGMIVIMGCSHGFSPFIPLFAPSKDIRSDNMMQECLVLSAKVVDAHVSAMLLTAGGQKEISYPPTVVVPVRILT